MGKTIAKPIKMERTNYFWSWKGLFLYLGKLALIVAVVKFAPHLIREHHGINFVRLFAALFGIAAVLVASRGFWLLSHRTTFEAPTAVMPEGYTVEIIERRLQRISSAFELFLILAVTLGVSLIL